MRLGGATTWAAVEADLLADGSGAGAAVAFSIFCPDWTAVDSLSVVAAPGVAAVRSQPGAWLVTGLVRGAAAAFYPAVAGGAPVFAVDAAAGRNATEANVGRRAREPAWGA